MLLTVKCEIEKNVKVEDYIAVSGVNHLTLEDGSTHTGEVLWYGSGSPYPTPPGGPWRADYIHNHKKFGNCFFVRSNREGDVFIHFGTKSYGCIMINKTAAGKRFFDKLMKAGGLEVLVETPDDLRSEDDKYINPIDYESMTEYIK